MTTTAGTSTASMRILNDVAARRPEGTHGGGAGYSQERILHSYRRELEPGPFAIDSCVLRPTVDKPVRNAPAETTLILLRRPSREHFT